MQDYLYPSICGKPFLYSDSVSSGGAPRFVVTLTMHVHRDILTKALKEALQRFPQMAVSIARDGESLVFVPYEGDVDICLHTEHGNPSDFTVDGTGLLFKVTCSDKTIFFDFHKTLCDEYGMITFIKSVIYRYLQLEGYPVSNDGTIKDVSGCFISAEGCDPMAMMYEKPASRPIWYMDAKAYNVKPSDSRMEQVVQVRIPLSKLKTGLENIANTPVTYIAPAFSHSVYKTYCDSIAAGEYVVASIRINLRPYFPTASFRPFYTPVFLAYNRNMEEYPFNTVLMSQKKLLEAQLKQDTLAFSAQRKIDDIERCDEASTCQEKKNQVAELIEKMSSMSTYDICRIGNLMLPDDMQRYVTEFYPILPSGHHAYSVSVVTFRGELVVTISGKRLTRQVCDLFVNVLNENDIKAFISDEFTFTPMNYKP